MNLFLYFLEFLDFFFIKFKKLIFYCCFTVVAKSRNHNDNKYSEDINVKI